MVSVAGRMRNLIIFNQPQSVQTDRLQLFHFIFSQATGKSDFNVIGQKKTLLSTHFHSIFDQTRTESNTLKAC